MSDTALESVKHSLALADQRGEPYVCATVHLRRDDLRAVLDEVERLRLFEQALQGHRRVIDSLEAEVERLRVLLDGSLESLREHMALARSAAERQREACIKVLVDLGVCGHEESCTCDSTVDWCVDTLRATPLVTEVEP